MQARKVPQAPHPERVIAETRAWVERAVIGLNLCPFARAVQIKRQIRYAVTEATDAEALLEALVAEMHALVAADPARIDTTLLIHPQVLGDFADYNDFLQVADDALANLDLEGVLQVASFHPHYRFAGTKANDVTNATNRSPYPTLHLLREASVDRAVAAFPEASAIYENNLVSLRVLGAEGWAALQAQCRRDAAGYEPPG
ncbi:MAG: DUF1415 domain-containing protein [Methylibium sp.]|uniref:DUF1415 domain-containing protein n=1 Tax=Methylibium sp. TaxID=2067992 RepID=UPI0017F760E2|nr:DUF1415 domain-containing protein [Methylibium sp.]MBA3598828.1 DUF1415 domain-containing protein [Methylibium sp.]